MNRPEKQNEYWLSEEEMSDAILGYLAEHPDASDTLVGIVDWWIMRYQIRVEINGLKKVLDGLVECGLLEKTEHGEQAQYRLTSKAVA